MAQLYPRALGSLFVAFYNSQGYDGGILTRLHTGPHLGPMARFILLSDICGLHVEGRPPWREDGSAIYSYNLLSLSGPSPAELVTTSYCLIRVSPQPIGPGPCIYIPQEQGGAIIPPGTGLPFCRLLRLAGLQWRYSNATAQTGPNVRARRFKAGLLARNQFASGRSYDRPTRSRFSVVFLGLRANAELVPKFQVVLHASHAALPMVILKISPYTNVTLTSDFDFWLDRLFTGDMGEGAIHREERK
jgi:hypothetical protein